MTEIASVWVEHHPFLAFLLSAGVLWVLWFLAMALGTALHVVRIIHHHHHHGRHCDGQHTEGPCPDAKSESPSPNG